MDAKTTPTAPPSRGTALIVATAAVTLAIGTTVAALSGYLGPRRAPVDPAPAQPVFVPVTNQPPVPPPAIAPAPEPEPVLAVYREHDDDDDDEHEDHDD